MADFARSRRLLLDGIKNFSIIFKILWQWKLEVVFFENLWQCKIEGYIFDAFAGYYLEELLIPYAKFSEKVSNE